MWFHQNYKQRAIYTTLLLPCDVDLKAREKLIDHPVGPILARYRDVA